jgi:outer membrane protein assembly factor BamB
VSFRKIAATLALALVAVFVMTGCPKPVPADPPAPTGPDSTWTGAPTAFKITGTIGSGSIRYVMDWGDLIDTLDDAAGKDETIAVAHTWTTVGTYSVKVQALNDAEPAKASNWSPAKSIRVLLNQPPVIDSIAAGQSVAVKDVPASFTIFATDPDGDSMRVRVKWGDNKDTLTDSLVASPGAVVVNHIYTQLETLQMVAWAIDKKGTESKPETTEVVVGTAGGVRWYWWNDNENQGPMTTSAIVALDEGVEMVYSGCEDDYKFYEVKAQTGKSTGSVTTKFPEYAFTGHGAACAATMHIIVGSEEGELYGLKMNTGKEWQWPDAQNEDSLKYFQWGSPAITGNKIYIGSENDSMYYFQDLGTQGSRIAAYGVRAGIIDAPAIDVQGNVLFSTDSGQLYKMDPNLGSPIWRAQLVPNGEIHGPILGADGTIYCTTADSFYLCAVNPADGVAKWKVALDGEALRPALGATALYVGTSYGKVYSINPATGATNWVKQLSVSDPFETTPIVVAGGYVYFQSTADIVYCVNQADGTLIWSCDCKKSLLRAGGSRRQGPRKLQLADYAPEMSILANGDIIVVGADALYCIAGYPERPLDPTAPWPKWQKNLMNTGK